MTEVRAHWTTRPLPLAVDSALLIGLILTATSGAHSPSVGAPREPTVLSPGSDGSAGAILTVDPPTFWMRTGENVSLQAVWTTDSALCSVAPIWFSWSVEEGLATGFLSSSLGANATFVADSFSSGGALVEIRSDAVLHCGANATVFERTAEVRVSIIVPLSLGVLELAPDPLPPGRAATLEGTLSGGDPPYSLEVVWDDGTQSIVNRSVPGSFRLNHTFASGDFVPYVLATDSEGDLANRSVSEALTVSYGLAAAVIAAHGVAEVGVPADFAGIAQDPPSGAVTIYDCSNATVGGSSWGPPEPNATVFSCTFDSPGTAEVLFGVYPPTPGGSSASAVLYEAVVSPPLIGVAPNESVGEVGVNALVRVSLSGGALPVSISWNLTGNRSGGSEAVTADGGGILVLPLITAGEYALGIRASDTFGGVGANATAVIRVEPELEARADGAGSLQASGALVQVAGGVLSGCPPFSWWTVPSLTAGNGPPTNGTLRTIGSFSWNATYLREGSVGISAGVADACGGNWQTDLEVPLIPTLVAGFAVAPASDLTNETLTVNVSIEGGWGPFRLLVDASDNESWNRTLPSTGSYGCRFVTRANGSLSLAATVLDSLGSKANFSATVFLQRVDSASPPPPSETPGGSSGLSAPSPLDVLGLVASLGVPTGIAASLVILWRRRLRKKVGKPAGPDPEVVLKRIIEPAEGAERFTVELLAEEAGVPLEVVRATIDRLVSQGTIRSDCGADGEEVLSWSSGSGH